MVPIPGTRRLDRIEQNAAAADVELTDDDLRSLDEAVPRAGVGRGPEFVRRSGHQQASRAGGRVTRARVT